MIRLHVRKHDSTRMRVWLDNWYGDQFDIIPYNLFEQLCSLSSLFIIIEHTCDCEN